MTSIDITPRFRTIINRAIEMKWKKFVEDGEKTRKNDKLFEKFCSKDDDELYFQLYYKDLYLVMEHSPENRNHECDEHDEDDLVLNSHTCDCSKEVEYEIFITNKKGSSFYYTRLFTRKFTKSHTLEQVLLEFVSLPEFIEICQCGKVAAKDKWCDECYIWRIDHPTDSHCAICHENEGQYVVTECGHYFHAHCWRFLEYEKGKGLGKKCPLCRKVTDSNAYRD